MPIRIALVIARLNIGGPATHVVELAAALPRDRFSVRVFAGRVGPGEQDMHYLARGAGVTVEDIPELSPSLGIRDLPALFRLRKIFREWQPDIVHTHTAKAGALGRAAARMSGVPAVAHTFHGHVLRGYFSPPAEWVFRRIERMLAGWTDRIITLSPALKQDLVNMRIAPPEKIAVIPLGMNLRPLLEARLRRGELRREWGAREDQPLIGIVGRLVPIKNHRLFLEAVRSMVDSGNPARFVIIGDGELRPALEAQAREGGFAGRVVFAGWRQDMADVYGALDILALTSENEGTPVALIEAMAAGVPVAATAVGGVPDVVHAGVTGWLVPPGDPGAMADAWRDILADPARTGAITLAARASALDRYGSERMLAEMTALYQSLVDESISPARAALS